MNCFRKGDLFKEPLLHFLLIGAVLFLLYGWRGNPASLNRGQTGSQPAQIVVSRDAMDQMNGLFEKTWQQAPTEEQQKVLIEDFVRNEIYYREAIAIGLDRNDEVIKRRLRQRMEFIYEDISAWAEPTDEALRAFVNTHREKYLTDPKIAFRQVYISVYKRGKSAESDTRDALRQLAAGADPDSVGDATMLQPEVGLSSLSDIRKEFGDEFGKTLLGIKPRRWEGPVRSGFGLHLVFVNERVGGRLPDLNEIREVVKRDWTAEKQREIKDAAYAKIRERYTVAVEKPKAVTAPLTAAASKMSRTR